MRWRLSSSRGVAGALMVGVLTMAVVGVSAATTSASAPRVVAHTPYPACTAGGLVNWINTQSNGAAGTIYYQLMFTNLSGHTCTLLGYPGVSAVNIGNVQIGQPAVRESAPIHPYVLVEGGSVFANFGIMETAFFTPSTCHPAHAAGVRVYAPNQTFAKIVPFPFATCNSTSMSNLRIMPVQR